MSEPADILFRHCVKALDRCSEIERRIGRTDSDKKTSPELEAAYRAVRVGGHYCNAIVAAHYRLESRPAQEAE